MKNILITGGAGFIGYFLAKKLSGKYNVDIVDDFSRGKKDSEFLKLIKDKKIKFYNKNLLEKLTIRKKYVFIFHLAAIVGVKNVMGQPGKVLMNNVILLRNAINFAKKQSSLKKFFFFSTSEVYAGSIKNRLIKFPTPENQLICLPPLLEKRSTYLLSKIYGESICIHSGLPYVIVRPHNIFGPRMGMSHVIPEMAIRALSSSKVFKVYNSKHKRTFCYIDDFIDAISLLMKKKRSTNCIYNIGNPDEEISILNLSKKILKFYKKSKKIDEINIDNSSPSRRVPDITMMKKHTSFGPKISFGEGLSRTLLWYKKETLK